MSGIAATAAASVIRPARSTAYSAKHVTSETTLAPIPAVGDTSSDVAMISTENTETV